MRDTRLLVWNAVENRAFVADPSEITSADPVVAVNLDAAVRTFERRAPERETTFSQTRLAELLGGSYSTLRQFMDFGVLPVTGSSNPRKGKPRVFSWNEALIVALVGAFWRQGISKDGLRAIGDFLSEHIEELVLAADPVGVN